MTLKLFAARIFTCQWEEALAFYRDKVGLEVAFENAQFGWAQLDVGGAFIGLERCDQNDRESRSLVGRFTGISLEADDIHETYRTLSDRGVIFTSPPEVQEWGGTLAHFSDPDGNVITLLDKVPD